MGTEFEISKTGTDDYEWQLKDQEGEAAATGEGYASRDEAMEGAEAVKKAVGEAAVTDTTGEADTAG